MWRLRHDRRLSGVAKTPGVSPRVIGYRRWLDQSVEQKAESAVDANVLLQIVTLLVLGVGGYLGKIGKDALAKGVETSAEEGVKTAIKASTGHVSWLDSTSK